jgi:ketosteroid isomerase-like protein
LKRQCGRIEKNSFNHLDPNHLKSFNRTHDIYLARIRYNDAILHRNVDAICTFFASDYFIMTAQGIQSWGIPEQYQRWSASFESDPIVCYRRRTRDLRISEQFASAEEHGNWVGKYSLNQNVIFVAGVYSAKWKMQNDGKWLIQTEIFTILRSKVVKS